MYKLKSEIGTVPRGYANKSATLGIYCFIVYEYPPDYNSTTERSYYSMWWPVVNPICIFSVRATPYTIVFHQSWRESGGIPL